MAEAIPLLTLTGKLGQLYSNSLCRKIGVATGDNATVTLEQAAVFVLASILEARSPISQEQRRALIDALCDDIQAAVKKAHEESLQGEKRPVAALVIFDGTFATIAGSSKIIDLRIGDFVKSIPQTPIEAVSYDLLAATCAAVKKEPR